MPSDVSTFSTESTKYALSAYTIVVEKIKVWMKILAA